MGTGNNWITLKLVGIKSNRDGIGAKVTLHTGDDVIYREVSGGCGFGSTNSLDLEIGLGTHTKVDTLEIVWPSGQVDTYRNPSVNRRLVVTEGEWSMSENIGNTPSSALLIEDNMSLFVDYYQLTMGQADFDAQNDKIITANYYVRKVPQGQYLITAGLEQVIHYVLNLRFTDAVLDWLAQTGRFES